MTFLASILGWLTSGGIAAVGKQLNYWQEIKYKAQNDHEKLEAEQNITQLQVRLQALIDDRSTRWLRPLMVAPSIILLWKLLVWDKVLGWGVTENLSEELWWYVFATISYYLLTRPFEKGLRR